MGGYDDEKYDCAHCKRTGHCPVTKWSACYRTPKESFYEIEDTTIEGCPKQFIAPQSIELLQIVGRARAMKEATGAGMYGTDLSKYPSKLVDVMTTLENERIITDNAKYEAEQSERE